MAKRGRKPQAPYVTMWKEVIEGVRKVIIETGSKREPTVWRLYPTGKPEPYFGTVRKDDVESERRAVAKFERWKQSKAGTPWEQEVKEEPLSTPPRKRGVEFLMEFVGWCRNIRTVRQEVGHAWTQIGADRAHG